MLAWSEELITDVRNQKSWLWRHCRRRAIYRLLRSPSQTCHAKPKTQINRRRYQLLSCWWMSLKAVWPERLLSWKVRTLWHCSRLRSVALYLWLIGISVRQSTCCSNIWASLPGAGYGQFEHKADSLIAKFRSGRNGQRDWCMSRVTALSPLWLSASSSACRGLLIITVITHRIKPSATKMPENWSWRTRQLLTCRCVSVMLLRSMQNTRRS